MHPLVDCGVGRRMKPLGAVCLSMTFLSLCGLIVLIHPLPPFSEMKLPFSYGDLNGDGITDRKDAEILEQNFGTHNEVADPNLDTVVDIYDALVLSAHYGQVQFTIEIIFEHS